MPAIAPSATIRFCSVTGTDSKRSVKGSKRTMDPLTRSIHGSEKRTRQLEKGRCVGRQAVSGANNAKTHVVIDIYVVLIDMLPTDRYCSRAYGIQYRTPEGD